MDSYFDLPKEAYKNFTLANQKVPTWGRCEEYEPFIHYLGEFKKRFGQARELFKEVFHALWDYDAQSQNYFRWGKWSPYVEYPEENFEQLLSKIWPVCEYFYWTSFRAIQVAKYVPMVHGLKCNEIRDIRNHLIEHADGKKGGNAGLVCIWNALWAATKNYGIG